MTNWRTAKQNLTQRENTSKGILPMALGGPDQGQTAAGFGFLSGHDHIRATPPWYPVTGCRAAFQRLRPVRFGWCPTLIQGFGAGTG